MPVHGEPHIRVITHDVRSTTFPWLFDIVLSINFVPAQVHRQLRQLGTKHILTAKVVDELGYSSSSNIEIKVVSEESLVEDEEPEEEPEEEESEEEPEEEESEEEPEEEE